MKTLIWVLTLFVLAAGLALMAQHNEGNVVLLYPPYRIDINLSLFVLALLLLFALLYIILRSLLITWSMPERVAQYRERQLERKSNRALREALLAFFEGRFSRAERFSAQAAELPDNHDVAALLAARAAQRLQEMARQQSWLKSITQRTALSAKLVTEAELATDNHQAAEALTAIAQLQSQGARHIHTQRLALKAHQQLGQWAEVIRLVRLLAKREALHPVVAAEMKRRAYENQLNEKRYDAEALQRFWYDLPHEDRRDAMIALQGAKMLADVGLHEVAREAVEVALKHQWHSELILHYPACIGDKPQPMIEQAEMWLDRHSDDPALHLCMAQLCTHIQLWGKAQKHFDLAIALSSRKEEGLPMQPFMKKIAYRAHAAMAKMMENQGKYEQALAHYRAMAADDSL